METDDPSAILSIYLSAEVVMTGEQARIAENQAECPLLRMIDSQYFNKKQFS